MRFIGKNPHKKYVRQIPNSNIPRLMTPTVVSKKEEPVPVVEEVLKKPDVVENVESKKLTKKKTEDNLVKTENDMLADERLEKIENIIGEKAPKRKVKVEKKDKGLFERTDNSVIMLTEDNKMLLTD